jgi:hypothetical protein
MPSTTMRSLGRVLIQICAWGRHTVLRRVQPKMPASAKYLLNMACPETLRDHPPQPGRPDIFKPFPDFAAITPRV